MKVAIVYWSGTGNTENIMNLVKKGVEQAGAQADVYMPWDFEPSMMDQYTNFAFGSPAMGDEQLETEDFQPMWDSIADKLSGKKCGAFWLLQLEQRRIHGPLGSGCCPLRLQSGR